VGKPGSLRCVARSAKVRRGRKSRATSVGMTEHGRALEEQKSRSLRPKGLSYPLGMTGRMSFRPRWKLTLNPHLKTEGCGTQKTENRNWKSEIRRGIPRPKRARDDGLVRGLRAEERRRAGAPKSARRRRRPLQNQENPGTDVKVGHYKAKSGSGTRRGHDVSCVYERKNLADLKIGHYTSEEAA